MTTEIATINQEELDAFVARTGASSEDLQGGGDFLPTLKVNYQDEIEVDGVKVEIKPGLFTLTGQEIPSFAKNVKFRPLLHNYQYIKYDKEKEEVTNRSVIFNDFSDEARDEQGTLRCGRPPSKVLRENPDLKEQYKDVTLFRTVDGLVSYEGTDPNGKPVKVENVVATFRGKGANFTPFNDEYIKLLPKGSLLWDYELTLSVTKHKQDPKSAVSYFIVHFEGDFKERLPLTPELFDTLKGLQKRIEDTNKEIDKKYYAIVAENSKTDAALNAIDVTPLGEDFKDDENNDFHDEIPI